MIDKSIIKGYLLGDISIEFYIAFYVFSLIGIALSLFLHVKKKQIKTIKGGQSFKLNLSHLYHDNVKRVLASIIIIFGIIRFYPEVRDMFGLEFELNMFLGLLVGVFLDRIIILVRNKTNVNIFQTKEK